MPAKKWSVYILRCGDGSLYTGATNDLCARLARHGAGKGAAYTRSRLPVTLVFSEPAGDRGAALRREAKLKRLTRKQKLVLVKQAGPPYGAVGGAADAEPAARFPARTAKKMPSPRKRPPPTTPETTW